jgi:uroporphyrinogen-III synthase
VSTTGAASPHVGGALSGRGVLVTRPREQCAALVTRIEAAGGQAIVFPALEIVDAGDPRLLNALIDRLDRFDIAVFISPSAVTRAMHLILARRQLPLGLRVAAIGKGSARELHRFQVTDVLIPQGRSDSEALLAMAEFKAVRGKSVVIFRGEGGRDVLGNTLVERGARVEYAECYRRVRPNGDPEQLRRAWARGEIHAVIVTSAEAMRNLFAMVGPTDADWLRNTPLFVAHERIGAVARELGIATVVVTPEGDAGLVEGMIRFFAAEPLQ